MLGALSAVPWRLLGGIVVAAVIGALLWRNDALDRQRIAAAGRLAEVVRTAEANARAVTELQAAHVQALAAVERVAQDAASRATHTTIIREEIARAPDTMGCGSSVGAAVRWLRQQQPAATGDPR